MRWRTRCCSSDSTARASSATTSHQAGKTFASTSGSHTRPSFGTSASPSSTFFQVRTRVDSNTPVPLLTNLTIYRIHSDLCIRFKKIFSHELELYPPQLLPHHNPAALERNQKMPPLPRGLEITNEMGVHPM